MGNVKIILNTRKAQIASKKNKKGNAPRIVCGNMKSGENSKNDGNECSFGVVIYIHSNDISVSEESRTNTTNTTKVTKSNGHTTKLNFMNVVYLGKTYHKVHFKYFDFGMKCEPLHSLVTATLFQ